MKVASAIRRTDIPAFYSPWFMNRIREGCVRWANPFSKTMYPTSPRPEDVMAIVFWSKNYLPMLPHLDGLDNDCRPMLFHFTITGLPTVLEFANIERGPSPPSLWELPKGYKEIPALVKPSSHRK